MKKSRKELIEDIIPLFIEMGDTMFTLVLREAGKIKDLTISQLKVLKLVELRDNLKMKDIASELHIRPSAATYTVDNLIKEELLERYRCEDDRRVVRIKITEKGVKVVDAIKGIKGKIWRKILADLNEEDFLAFTYMAEKFQKLIRHVRESEGLTSFK